MSEDGKLTTASITPQHLRALERANEVRLARASLKRAVASGQVTAASVALECPWEAETMRLSELLMCQRRWGRTRTRKLLGDLGLAENKTVLSLTQRQRRLLASALREKVAPVASQHRLERSMDAHGVAVA